MNSQMGADWTPDDLLWCGVVRCGGAVCSGAVRRGERGKRGEQGHWAPDASLKFTLSSCSGGML